MKIIHATREHLHLVTPLFVDYRVFYKQSHSLEAAHAFLKERLELQDSVIFIAMNENEEALGFTQLYPSYSSVSLLRTYILNDLYVREASRGMGVGRNLLEHAQNFAIKKKAKGLTLETDSDNPAQFLYERMGWKKDANVFHYTWLND